MNRSIRYLGYVLAIGGIVTACADQPPTRASKDVSPATTASVAAPGKSGDDSKNPAAQFVPPDESEIPKNEYGEAVLLGKNIFVNTQQYAKDYVGNGLNCVNCHLDNGRKANSIPLWAAYVMYPAYRAKTGQIDTIQSRIQGCFKYSMNGEAPDFNSKEMTALVTYHYWLANNAPTGVKMPGQGLVKVAKPKLTPDLARGEEVFKNNCAICHGANGEGTKARGVYSFPPLWGKDSFNWGAGMHRIDLAAGFIKVNMPYGRFGTMSDQEAWDVALFMNSHERPADPRFEESLAHTRDKNHDENCLYGRTPAELVALLEKKAIKAKAEGKTAGEQSMPAPEQSRASGQVKGYSPATAH